VKTRGTDPRIDALRTELRSLGRVMVCFSGGVDSAYLLAESVGALGPENVVAFTAVSPSLDPEEAESARRLAETIGAEHLRVTTNELDDARYKSNPVDRCYFCKTEVYGAATREAKARGIEHVLDGFNLDDRGDHRPGRKAARELGVRSPLDDHGLDKQAIRDAARALDLPVWDKPALACLSSRFPYGTEITPDRLTRVARAEKALRALDFRVIRVRYHGDRARIELGVDELERAERIRAEIVDAVRAAGFEAVEIDPRGYRRGSLNVF
jgi:uncharacterized protein